MPYEGKKFKLLPSKWCARKRNKIAEANKVEQLIGRMTIAKNEIQKLEKEKTTATENDDWEKVAEIKSQIEELYVKWKSEIDTVILEEKNYSDDDFSKSYSPNQVSPLYRHQQKNTSAQAQAKPTTTSSKTNKFLEKENTYVAAALVKSVINAQDLIHSKLSSEDISETSKGLIISPVRPAKSSDQKSSMGEEELLNAIHQSDRAFASKAIALYGIETVRKSYGKKWKDRNDGLNGIKEKLIALKEGEDPQEYLDSALPIICSCLRDSLFAEKRVRHVTNRTIIEILSSDQKVAKSFLSRFITPFNNSKNTRTDRGRAEVVWNILNRFSIPNREIGLVEQHICQFAKSCLIHIDPEIRNIGKNIFVLVYSCSGNKNYIKSQLATSSYLKPDRSPLLKEILNEFNAIDGTSSKQRLSSTKIKWKSSRVPKVEDLKRPKTITLVDNDCKAALENESVDYDKICMFCGQFNELFTPEGLDEHFLNSCFMLTKCNYCKEILEISMLKNHYLEECPAKDQFKKCYRCKNPIPKEKHFRHVSLNQCKVTTGRKNREQCFLCQKEVFPSNDIGWRKHLKDKCPANPRARNSNTLAL